MNNKIFKYSIFISIFIIFFCFCISAKANNEIDKNIVVAKSLNKPRVFYLDHSKGLKKVFLNEKIFLSYGYKWGDIKIVNEEILNSINDTNLIKLDGKSAVFYILGNKKILIKSEEEFTKLGFDWNKILTVNETEFNSYENSNIILDNIVINAKADFYISKNKNSQEVCSWPTNNKNIYYYFHDKTYPYKYISEHEGIDIESPQGSEVKAIASGKIIKSVTGKNNDYSYIEIEHKNGLISHYGHLSKIFKSINESVNENEIIGLSGGAPSTSGSGNYSSGPHLHLEIIKNKVAVNPLIYIN